MCLLFTTCFQFILLKREFPRTHLLVIGLKQVGCENSCFYKIIVMKTKTDYGKYQTKGFLYYSACIVELVINQLIVWSASGAVCSCDRINNVCMESLKVYIVLIDCV